jgi:hypothetical protein
MQKRKNFIHKNEEFTCENCNKTNPKLAAGCRNHCKFCLFSKHVDKDLPGDRQNTCHGLMEPTSVDYNNKKGHIIIHKCKLCGAENRNKMATDDNFEIIINLSVNQLV